MGKIHLSGTLICRNEAEAAIVERCLPAHIDATRAEKGCVTFRVEPTDDPLIWSVDEVFLSREAFNAHQERIKNSEWGRETVVIQRSYTISEEG